jgi:membrane associated rhomboid family serine protease
MAMEHLPRQRSPILNVPGVVTGLIAAMVAVHLIRLYGPFDNEAIIYYFAFIPARLAADAATMARAGLLDQGARYWSLITYAFIHADWLHLAMNSVWMLAFGSVVARRLTALRFLLLSGLGAIAGALMYYAFHPGVNAVLVGASAAVSAEVAAAARLMFVHDGRLRWGRGQEIGRMKPLSLIQTFTNRRSLTFILIWLGLNYAVGATGLGTPEADMLIAWEAHLGGFIAGLLALGIVDQRDPAET